MVEATRTRWFGQRRRSRLDQNEILEAVTAEGKHLAGKICRAESARQLLVGSHGARIANGFVTHFAILSEGSRTWLTVRGKLPTLGPCFAVTSRS